MARRDGLRRPRRVLVVDVGGTHVKVLATIDRIGEPLHYDLAVLLAAARNREDA